MLYATELRALGINNGSTRLIIVGATYDLNRCLEAFGESVGNTLFLLQDEDQEKFLSLVEISFRLLTEVKS